MNPFFRWVGGKRQLLPAIAQKIPYDIETYYEPFVGGGAVLLHVLETKKAKRIVATDLNDELINFYNCVQKAPNSVHEMYCTFSNDVETFKNIRSMDRSECYKSLDPILRAARFLYLNKTSFQGLWRINKKGHHNTPYGRPKSIKVSLEKINEFSTFIKDVLFVHVDFQAAIALAKSGDFVYFDPPYYPTSKTSGFTQYAMEDFSHHDQVRLRNECRRLYVENVGFLLSQSDCSDVRELYDEFLIENIVVTRNVSAKSSSRGKTTEVLVCAK